MSTTTARARADRVPGATTSPPEPGDRRGAEAEAWLLYALLASSACIIVGLLWDISWHMSIGRDTLWSPPHVLEQVGAALAGLGSGALVLRTTFAGGAAERGRAVRFWGFRGPLGAWVAIWGALAMIFSVPFDDWWHNAYGLDVEILSPPHVVLLFGMVAIQAGAMLLALGLQNRSGGRRLYGFGFAFAAGALLAMVGTAASDYTLWPNLWRSTDFYRVGGALLPLLLVTVGRAGRLRWSATAAAAVYMVVFLIPQWILVQFPATPRLTPIVNPIETMAAFGFPLVLVIPALGIDVALRRWDGIGDWKLSALLGAAFVILLLAIHWPLARFLVESPLAQNDLFLAEHWPYSSGPGDYRTSFWGVHMAEGGGTGFAANLGVATLVAMASSRVGLWWGRWMRRVRR